MGAKGLAEDIKVVRLKPDGSTYAVAAGTSTITSDILDTAGYGCVTLLLGFGAIVSLGVPTVKVQQDTAAGGGTMADLLGSLQTLAHTDDNKIVISEVVDPQERYIRTIITRPTSNATVDFLIAILSGSRTRPVTSHATVFEREVFSSPLEGTA